MSSNKTDAKGRPQLTGIWMETTKRASALEDWNVDGAPRMQVHAQRGLWRASARGGCQVPPLTPGARRRGAAAHRGHGSLRRGQCSPARRAGSVTGRARHGARGRHGGAPGADSANRCSHRRTQRTGAVHGLGGGWAWLLCTTKKKDARPWEGGRARGKRCRLFFLSLSSASADSSPSHSPGRHETHRACAEGCGHAQPT